MEIKAFLAKLDDKVKKVIYQNQVQVTDFADPVILESAKNHLDSDNQVNYLCWGGFEEAERKRIILSPAYEEPKPNQANITLLELRGNLRYVTPCHRDYLGAVLGQGIKRERIGDICLTKEGCVIIISSELIDFFLVNEIKIRGVLFKSQRLDLENWKPDISEGKSICIQPASLRLDAVIAKGFNISRNIASGMIKGGKVKVNWRIIENSDYKCKENDIISFRGKGRVIVNKVNGETRKGRIKLNITRYK